jgi:hypothetical protein
MSKVKHTVALCTLLGLFTFSAAAEPAKPWLLMADWQKRDADFVSHAGGVTGSFGRSRSGAELIYQEADRALDWEWYRYEHRFAGGIAGTERSYGDAQDLILSGFRQWQVSPKYAAQVIYGLEWAAEDAVGQADGFRWGLGGAVRWHPDAETDVALGLMLQDRFENSILPVPYVKAVWRPCRYAEVELRATGLQNGVIFRGFPTGDRSTTVDLLVAYETLNFRSSKPRAPGSCAASSSGCRSPATASSMTARRRPLSSQARPGASPAAWARASEPGAQAAAACSHASRRRTASSRSWVRSERRTRRLVKSARCSV